MELIWSTERGLEVVTDRLAAAVRRPRVIAAVLVEPRRARRPETRSDGLGLDEATWEDATWQ